MRRLGLRGMAETTLIAESTTIENRPTITTTAAEGILAEVLAGVLHVDRVPVDSHFFDDLRADSLVMAHFCARVRKRGTLPPVSMRDVYRHPTIRSLAAAVADLAPNAARPSVAPPIELPTSTSTREYVLCGALQACFLLGYSYVALLVIVQGYSWISDGSNAVDRYLRWLLFSSA